MAVAPRETVGLIGSGLVGRALARRLMAAGYALVGHDIGATIIRRWRDD